MNQHELIADALHEAHLDDCDGCGLSGVEPWMDLAERLNDKYNIRYVDPRIQHEKIADIIAHTLGLVLQPPDINALMIKGLRFVEEKDA